MRLRIYDKAAEQEVEDLDWTRIELQARAPKAGVISNELRAGKYAGSVFIGVIRGFCDFPDDVDWVRVMAAPEVKVQARRNESDGTRDWLEKVCVPALTRYQAAFDDFDLAEKFRVAADAGKKRPG